MCIDPLTSGLLTFAVGAAQSVATYQAQRQDAKNQRAAASAAFTEDQKSISLRQMQEQDAASQKRKLSQLEDAELVAEATVQAAEGGVAGVSVENVLADITRRGARNRQTIADNTKMITVQLQQEKRGSRATAQSRTNAAPKPSALGLVAGIGGAALDGYNAKNKYIQ